MLTLFLQSEKLANSFSLTFSYRYSKSYHRGLRARVKNFQGKTYPLRFIHFYSHDQLPKLLPILFRRIIFNIITWLLTYPLLIYQVIVIRKLLIKISPDILHINNAGYPGSLSARAAAIAGRFAGVPRIIMVVNNMALGYSHYSRWLDYPIDLMVVKSVFLFITGSKSASNQLKLVLKLPSNKLNTIHNGIALRNIIDCSRVTRKRLGLGGFNGVVFGVVALLVPRKGHQVLLDAVLKLVSEKNMLGHQFKILIEGSGPLRKILDKFITDNKLHQWVVFVGDEKNIIDFISAIDVLILPSIQDEDFPNVILEAMALGKAVIASRLAGTPEQIVDGITGFLVEPRNVEQLADAIFNIVDKPNYINSMGIAGLKRFNNLFTSLKALENYSNLYKNLILDKVKNEKNT